MARKAPVTRQDLIELSRVGMRRRTLIVLLALAFLFAWVFVLFNFLDDLFGRFGPRSIVALAALPIIGLFAALVWFLLSMPKCPLLRGSVRELVPRDRGRVRALWPLWRAVRRERFVTSA